VVENHLYYSINYMRQQGSLARDPLSVAEPPIFERLRSREKGLASRIAARTGRIDVLWFGCVDGGE
jgi:hypothetical protein